MKRLFVLLFATIIVAGCERDQKVIIRGTLGDVKEGMIWLDLSDVSISSPIDSARIKNGRFSFREKINGPEFMQVRTGDNDFISLLATPGDQISLELGGSPLVMNYEVTGSEESSRIRDLDQKLYATRSTLDSLRKAYREAETDAAGTQRALLEQKYLDVIDAQRKYTISFILGNVSSLSAIKALYQRIDDNTYVLYQPRDLQFLKIVSDTLSVKYPASRQVRALKENVTSELNQMYINRLANLAAQNAIEKTDASLPDTEGKKVTLSSLRGKYVLVTFWSTASQACVDEIPLLKSIYSQYRNKGLEIYQVNLDNDINLWKGAVKYEEIPWISVREEDPANPYFARILNIRQVPSNVLYDPQGNIINSNLFGRNLQIRMDQLFNKN